MDKVALRVQGQEASAIKLYAEYGKLIFSVEDKYLRGGLVGLPSLHLRIYYHSTPDIRSGT